MEGRVQGGGNKYHQKDIACSRWIHNFVRWVQKGGIMWDEDDEAPESGDSDGDLPYPDDSDDANDNGDEA